MINKLTDRHAISICLGSHEGEGWFQNSIGELFVVSTHTFPQITHDVFRQEPTLYGPISEKVLGFLVGRGITFFGSQDGWGTSMIQNMEMVLANSSIVNANAQANPDLFWALKGGYSNFGVVTQFELKAFPVIDIYGGTSLYEPQYTKDYLDAVASYVPPGSGSDDVLALINPFLSVAPSTGSVTISTFASHVGADSNPEAFANFTKIPGNSTNSVRATFSAFADETDLPVYSDRSSRYALLSIFLI